MNIAVVGHVSRQNQAHRLARAWGARLFLDSGQLGEWTNHRRAWKWCASQPWQDWSLVLQDDALPVQTMLTDLTEGLKTLPDEGLVSLYLGTGYPRAWQRRIRRALDSSGGACWAEANHLLHGVAVAAPTAWADNLVDVEHAQMPYDDTLSLWVRREKRSVFYTLPSLVDHADGQTLVDHRGQARTEPRRAWQIGSPDWNGRVVQL